MVRTSVRPGAARFRAPSASTFSTGAQTPGGCQSGEAMIMVTISADQVLKGEADSGATARLYSKVGWHILPLLMLCYVVAFLDRINIGYAQLQMKSTLTFSDATYS